MVQLSFASFNVRGLCNPNKRSIIFKKLEHYDISFLQETYVTDNKISAWRLDWKGEIIYHPGTNNSKGMMILFKRNVFDSTSTFYSSERVLGLKAVINGEEYFFINVYGTSEDKARPAFYNQLYNVINLCSSKNIIIGGDFNIVMDNKLDIVSGKKHDEVFIQMFNNWVTRKKPCGLLEGFTSRNN